MSRRGDRLPKGLDCPAFGAVQVMLDALGEPAALVSQTGEIMLANNPWKKNARKTGMGGAVGDQFPCPIDPENPLSPQEGGGWLQPYKIEAATLIFAGENYTFVRATHATELNALKHERLMLEDYLLRTQAQERRRIARDLHDVTAQLLVGLQLNIMQLKEGPSSPRAGPLLEECVQTLDELQTTIRGFRFSGTPDDWASEGIAKALDRMAASFARRTGLQIETDASIEREPSAAIAGTIYRIAQEALSNVHRHAKATKALLLLTANGATVRLTVRDNGVAPQERPAEATPIPGVGMAGIQERVTEREGKFSVCHGSGGTVVDVLLPVLADETIDP